MPAAGQTTRHLEQQAASHAAMQFPSSPRPSVDTPHGHKGLPGDAPVSDEQIETALAKTLGSPEFHSVPQLRAFLEYVVRATLGNHREKIKGYTIAVEALGRSDDFNPVTDPIVRVEAARLRRRLARYHEGSGATDPIHIIIPKGGYAPEFHPVNAGASAQSPLAEPDGAAPSSAEPPRTGAIDAADGGQIALKDTVTAAATAPVAPPHGAQPASWGILPEMTKSLRNAMQHPSPFPLAAVFGLLGFLAGFLAASL